MKSLIFLLFLALCLPKMSLSGEEDPNKKYITYRRFLAQMILAKLKEAGRTFPLQRQREFLGIIGVWTAWGSWSECPECRKFGYPFPTQVRRRRCEIEGGGVPMPNTCAGTDVDTQECRQTELCEAEAKNQSVCNQTIVLPSKSEAPWMVSIGFEDNSSWTHKCVGSILTSNAILTSSKCMKSTTWQIRTGAENLKNQLKENV